MQSNSAYFNIKDTCRKGLLKYLERAIARIPTMEKPNILDAGCGSGVPTLFLAEKLEGLITAIDIDAKSIARLREKVKELNLLQRFHLSCCSMFDLEANNQFDIIVAEGILNIIGFEKGFLRLAELLKQKGFVIIHDELRDQHSKRELIESNGFKIIDSYVLDEQIWWNDYYKCLEKEIRKSTDEEFLKLFTDELLEIESFIRDSSLFKSIYYVLQKS